MKFIYHLINHLSFIHFSLIHYNLVFTIYSLLNQRSDRFYDFTLFRTSVTQLILETAPRIFPKLGMKFIIRVKRKQIPFF